MEHDFVLVLTGIDDVSDEAADALYEAGCDDGTISERSGRVYITFSRRAPSLQEAILSAIDHVRAAKIGADVLRVDYCNLVSQSDIARRISRTRQLVNQFIQGTRGPGGFPPPACHLCDEHPLWYWCEVAAWLWENDMIKEEALRDAEAVELINGILEWERQKKREPNLAKEVLSRIGSH